MAADYPLPMGFHFLVDLSVDGKNSGDASDPDAKFQSVSGLSVDIEMEEIAEGGENRFKHKIPVKTKFPNLVLKRGLLISSELTGWIKDAVENFSFSPRNINILLLNHEHKTIYTWRLVNAIPVKWNVDTFNAEESKILIETLELSYNYFTTDTTQHPNEGF